MLFPPIQGYYWFPPGPEGTACSFKRFNKGKIIHYALFNQQGVTASEGRLGNVELWQMGTYHRSGWNTVEVKVLMMGGRYDISRFRVTWFGLHFEKGPFWPRFFRSFQSSVFANLEANATAERKTMPTASLDNIDTQQK